MRIHMLNTAIDNLTMSETLARVASTIERKKQLHHVVVNAGKIVAMQQDPELRESVNGSDLINADGQAVVWASRILGKPLKERVAGIDLMEEVVALAAEKGYSIFFLGAREEVVATVVKKYESLHGKPIIAGYRNGYFDRDDEGRIAEDISNSGAKILFVAISSPKKETFLFRNRRKLADVYFIMGVGGSFDVVSGNIRRAPGWLQEIGMEWFYRLIQEPGRMWRRYLVGNTKFILLVLKERFGH